MDLETKARDRWAIDWPGDNKATAQEHEKTVTDRLGDHAAARYRHFRRSVEQLDFNSLVQKFLSPESSRHSTYQQRFVKLLEDERVVDQELFGLVLSAESMRDEMHVFEKESSALIRLAQTGVFVRQLQRLHAVLDAVVASYPIEFDEASKWTKWTVDLSEERLARATWYRQELERANLGTASTILDDVDSDDKAEDVMTLLMAAVNNYGPASNAGPGEELTFEELDVIKTAFNMVATRSNIVVMTLPTWFVSPFEFGATFGMSTWGNDRFVPDHKDKERFIREASGWSELNHPHVAKFLGACHVGEEMFIVHEKVRSMMEYVSVVGDDRRRVWGRMYEVGLALQYMFARGFRCPDVKLDHLCCSQYEDRAVILGVHLRDYTAVCDPKRSHQFEDCFAESQVEALMIAIVKLFENMKELTSNGLASQDSFKDRLDIDNLASVPTTQPSCLDRREWGLLTELRKNPGVEVLRVIDCLGELAGVQEQNEWLEFVPILERQIGASTKVMDIKVTMLGETIGGALTKCRTTIPASEKSLGQLLKRFEDICFQLQQQWSGVTEKSPPITPIAHLCSLLRQLQSVAAQSASSSSNSSQSVTNSTSISVWHSTNLLQHQTPSRIYAFHSKLDQFLVLNLLTSSPDIHEWLPEWQNAYGNSSTMKKDPLDSPDSLSISQWFIPREQIDFEQFNAFSEGAFGSVHKGKWFQTPVIVKRVKQHTTTETQFRQEADVWFQLNHINVVKMYGACDIGDLFFVCEYASGGDLDKYLDSKGRDPYLMWYCLLNAALGLQYLHNNGIVHADLKANNILVGGDGVAKLTDFGLSVRAKDPSGASAGALGAYQWKAPECLSGSVATFASDVYSFAMVMIEVMSGSCPWGNGTEDLFVKVQVKKGLLPPRPLSIGDSEWGLIERMCARDPSVRVTMDGVVVHLSSLLQKLDQDQLWIDGIAQTKVFKNRVVARDGVLLNLVDLTKSHNSTIATHAASQIVSVAESRDGPSSQRELDAVLDIFFHGIGLQKALAVQAIGILAKANHSVLVKPKVISELMVMLTCGTATEQTQATNALSNFATVKDLSDWVLSASGIQAVMALVENGNERQKQLAARLLANQFHRAVVSDSMFGASEIEALIFLVRDGNDDQKDAATRALANLAMHVDITKSVTLANGIEVLLALVRDGTYDHKHAAVTALANLCNWQDLSKPVTSANGIEVLLELVRDGPGDLKHASARAIANLSKRNDISDSVASENGIEALLELVRNGNEDEKKQAAWAFANLSRHADISESMLAGGGIESLLSLVQDGTDEQKIQASRALTNMSGHADVSAPVLSTNGVESLLKLVRDGINEQRKYALTALSNLSLHADISRSFLAANGVELLLDLIRVGIEDLKHPTVMILENLSRRADISQPLVCSNGIDSLFTLLCGGTKDQKEGAAATLANLSLRADISEPVLAAHGIHVLLQLVRDGTDGLKKHAAMTLAGLALRADITTPVIAGDGIEALVELVKSGTSDQKNHAAWALSCLSADADIRETVLAVRGIEPLVMLARDGSDGHKYAAVMMLANISARGDINEQVLASHGVEVLLTTMRTGTPEQRQAAARTLGNLSDHGDISEPVLMANGIPSLLAFMNTGSMVERRAAIKILANLSRHTDISNSVTFVRSIDDLSALVRRVTGEQ